MSVFFIEQDCFLLKASLILSFHETNPYEISVTVDDEEALPEAVGGGR
jgi:hypothetical protein